MTARITPEGVHMPEPDPLAAALAELRTELLEYIDAVRDEILGGAPAGLDDLAGIARSIGGDPNFAASVQQRLDTKADR